MFLKKSRKTIHFENFIFNYQFKSVFNSLLETSSGWLGRTKEILPRRRHFGTFVTQTALNTPRKEQKKLTIESCICYINVMASREHASAIRDPDGGYP